MYPELLKIGPVLISSYGVLLVMAFFSGIYIINRMGVRRGLDPEEIINLAIVIMISAIIGARLLYVLFHLAEFEGRWHATFWPVQRDGTIGLSGLVLLGGVVGAIIASVIYIRRKKLPLWKYADSIAPALAFGIFLGRIGCFLNGCCFGEECAVSWGISFPEHSIPYSRFGDSPIHPTQLYSAAYALLIFFILIRLEKPGRYDGFLAGMFLILYGVSRFTVDFFRYYESQMYLLPGIDLNQIVSALMVVGGVLILYKKHTILSGATSANQVDRPAKP